MLDPAEQRNAWEHVVGDLVDEHPQILVEHLARDRLLDEVKLCRARIVIAANPAQKEPREPRLSLISGDRCPFLGGVVSANHGDGVPLTGAADGPGGGRSAGDGVGDPSGGARAGPAGASRQCATAVWARLPLRRAATRRNRALA